MLKRRQRPVHRRQTGSLEAFSLLSSFYDLTLTKTQKFLDLFAFPSAAARRGITGHSDVIAESKIRNPFQPHSRLRRRSAAAGESNDGTSGKERPDIYL